VPRSEVMRDGGKGSTAAAAGEHAVRRSRSSAGHDARCYALQSAILEHLGRAVALMRASGRRAGRECGAGAIRVCYMRGMLRMRLGPLGWACDGGVEREGETGRSTLCGRGTGARREGDQARCSSALLLACPTRARRDGRVCCWPCKQICLRGPTHALPVCHATS
jgi:hypothetical protein